MLSSRCPALLGLPCPRQSARQLSLSATRQAGLGFIGLGNMGRGMAANLLAKGHSLTVYDVESLAVDELAGRGAEAAAGAGAAAANREVKPDKYRIIFELIVSQVVVTMLPHNAAVERVYRGEGGVLATAQPGALLIDSSTVDPALSRALAGEAAAAGCQFVDAPVSGGINAAAAGTLTFMVGADSAAEFSRAEAVLSCMGAKVTHCGGVGTGGAVKICNNMLLAVSMIGTAEAMNLGIQ